MATGVQGAVLFAVRWHSSLAAGGGNSQPFACLARPVTDHTSCVRVSYLPVTLQPTNALCAGLRLQCKYKGHSNRNTQIRGSFSADGNSIICGSDDGYVYIWTLEDGASSSSQTASKKVCEHSMSLLTAERVIVFISKEVGAVRY